MGRKQGEGRIFVGFRPIDSNSSLSPVSLFDFSSSNRGYGGAGDAGPEVHEVLGDGGFDREAGAGDGVGEGHAVGVQSVTVELEERAIVVGERLVGASREKLRIRPVELVAHDGAADGG